jgi:hypothetical protein
VPPDFRATFETYLRGPERDGWYLEFAPNVLDHATPARGARFPLAAHSGYSHTGEACRNNGMSVPKPAPLDALVAALARALTAVPSLQHQEES